MAKATNDVGASHFSACSIVNDNLRQLCQNIDMKPSGTNSFAGRADSVARKALMKAGSKDWSITPRSLDERSRAASAHGR